MLDKQERDPIERIRKLLLAHNIATANDLKVPPAFVLVFHHHLLSVPCLLTCITEIVADG